MADFPIDSHDVGVLRLQMWGSIRGQFAQEGRPVQNASIRVHPIRLDNLILPRIYVDLDAQTDGKGRFDFPRVPPVPINVRVSASWPWRDEKFQSAPSMPVDLQPGQQADLDLGVAGTTLKGKVKLIGNVPTGVDCHWSINFLIRRAPGVKPPNSISRLGFDARKGWQQTWLSTNEGLAYLETLDHWHVKLAPDGTFHINGVPTGEYDLAVQVYAKPDGCLVDPLAQKVTHVTVTAADVDRGELTLAEIAAPVVAIPAVGDVPVLTFEHDDGSAGTLEELHGRYVIVHFWASWCGPCKQQLPAVQKLHDDFVSTSHVAIISLSLDDDPVAWHGALKEYKVPWSHGRFRAETNRGVSSVPSYWLLDPTGKILVKSSDIGEIRRRLDEAQK
jgi:thiol-disulfide isomerase/thioredoxin